MYFLHNSGLELPVYPPEQVAWSQGDIIEAVRSGATSVLRRAVLEHVGDGDLRTKLALAKCVYKEAAAATGTEILDPAWGLSRLTTSDARIFRHFQPPCIPSGYGLVAEVPVVPNASGLAPHQSAALAPLITSYREDRHTSGYYMGNLYAHQCVTIRPQEPFVPGDGSTFIVDIDPILWEDGQELNVLRT